MANSVYLASSEGLSGKSAVALGILDQLSRRVERVGVFRPIVRSQSAESDHVLDLLLSRLDTGLTAAEASAVGYEDVQALAPPVFRHRILTNFHAQSERVTSEKIVAQLLESVEAPRSRM